MLLISRYFLVASAAILVVSVSCFAPTVLPFKTRTDSFLMPTISGHSTDAHNRIISQQPKIHFTDIPNEVAIENPLRVIIAGGGVGGLALANSLVKLPNVSVTVIERTSAFKRFGGPIQLASNALQILSVMDTKMYEEIMAKFTFTGDKMNGIKDGLRDDWYATFDLKTPAKDRNMPYTGVIERPDLQEIYLSNLPDGTMMNGDGLESYVVNREGYGVSAITESGQVIEGDILSE